MVFTDNEASHTIAHTRNLFEVHKLILYEGKEVVFQPKLRHYAVSPDEPILLAMKASPSHSIIWVVRRFDQVNLPRVLTLDAKRLFLEVKHEPELHKRHEALKLGVVVA